MNNQHQKLITIQVLIMSTSSKFYLLSNKISSPSSSFDTTELKSSQVKRMFCQQPPWIFGCVQRTFTFLREELEGKLQVCSFIMYAFTLICIHGCTWCFSLGIYITLRIDTLTVTIHYMFFFLCYKIWKYILVCWKFWNSNYFAKQNFEKKIVYNFRKLHRFLMSFSIFLNYARNLTSYIIFKYFLNKYIFL